MTTSSISIHKKNNDKNCHWHGPGPSAQKSLQLAQLGSPPLSLPAGPEITNQIIKSSSQGPDKTKLLNYAHHHSILPKWTQITPAQMQL